MPRQLSEADNRTPELQLGLCYVPSSAGRIRLSFWVEICECSQDYSDRGLALGEFTDYHSLDMSYSPAFHTPCTNKNKPPTSIGHQGFSYLFPSHRISVSIHVPDSLRTQNPHLPHHPHHPHDPPRRNRLPRHESPTPTGRRIVVVGYLAGRGHPRIF